MLQIELSQENLDLLLEAPRAEPTPPFTPNIEQRDVVWVKDRSHVRCTYWDPKTNRRRTKSQSIEFDSDCEESQKQEIVNREAEAMQQFFVANHDRAGKLSCRDRSAESAIDEPSRKAAKTEASAESAPPDQQSND